MKEKLNSLKEGAKKFVPSSKEGWITVATTAVVSAVAGFVVAKKTGKKKPE